MQLFFRDKLLVLKMMLTTLRTMFSPSKLMMLVVPFSFSAMNIRIWIRAHHDVPVEDADVRQAQELIERVD